MSIKEVQTQLKQLGLYSGEVDGIWGKNSRNAFADLVDCYKQFIGVNEDHLVQVNEDVSQQQKNLKAFLDTIAYAEGTIKFGDQNGYNVIVGGETFDDYLDHPQKLVSIPRYGIKSSAAGRYQLLGRYWKHYKKQLGLKDFSPDSQDAVAIQQIKEQGAYNDIMEGRIRLAISKVANIWASFPSAGYGQREVDMEVLIEYYKQRGGQVND